MISIMIGLFLIFGGIILLGIEYSLAKNSKKPVERSNTTDKKAYETYKKSIDEFNNRTSFQNFFKLAVGIIFIFCGLAIIFQLINSNVILIILVMSMTFDRYVINRKHYEASKK